MARPAAPAPRAQVPGRPGRPLTRPRGRLISRSDTAPSITEEEQQVSPAALHALEHLRLGRRPLEHIRPEPQPLRELVLEDDGGGALIADPLLQLHVEILSD